MKLKILTLFSILISLGKPQHLENHEFLANERLLNFGPSTVHSIKGKFFEEKEIKILPYPAITDGLTKLKASDDKIDTEKQTSDKTFVAKATAVDTDVLKKQLTVNPINNLLNTVHNKRANDSVYIPKPYISSMDPPVTKPFNFYTENLRADVKKNDTVETIRKELSFDSLLIQNNYEKAFPPNLMNEYMVNEINPEVDINYSAKILPTDDNQTLATDNANDTRRQFPDVYYEPIPPEAIKRPIMGSEDMFLTNTNYKNNVNDNIAPLQLDTTTIKKEEDISSSCDDQESNEIIYRSSKDIPLKEPTKGLGISDVLKSRIMLMDHPRVCFACNSVNDPSCWSPDRTTAVKYCRADHPACLIKLYKYKGLSYTTRDCGNFCNRTTDGSPKYTYCTICHHDLCNSGHLTSVQYVIIITLVLFNLRLTR